MKLMKIIVCIMVLIFLLPENGMTISRRKTARSKVLTVQKKMDEIKVPSGKVAVKFEMIAFDYNIKDEESLWKIVDKDGKVHYSCEVVDKMSGKLQTSGELSQLTLGPGTYTLELITQNGIVEIKYTLVKSKE